MVGIVIGAFGLFAMIGAQFPEIYQPQFGYTFNNSGNLKGGPSRAANQNRRTLDEHGFPVTPEASVPKPFAHPAMTGNARMAAGNYPLGDG